MCHGMCMLIGILSDTHGNIDVTKKAILFFKDANVSAIFHAGDIGSHAVLKTLSELDVSIHAVLGNVDLYNDDFKYHPIAGIQMYGRFGDITCAEKRISLIHSDDRSRFISTVSNDEFDYIFSGHTHTVHDYTEGKTRCINPGTAGRGAPNTCAVLDLKTDILKVIEL